MMEQAGPHIVVCNWHEGGERVVHELHAEEAAPDTEIVVVTEADVNEEELRKSPTYEKVQFIRGDPALHHVLRGARVSVASTVIILADRDSPDPDAKSVLIALAVTRQCQDDDRPKPRILAEAINHRRMVHLKDAGVDEALCAVDFGLGILAQCALNAKLSVVYNNLLTYSADTNEVYLVVNDRRPRNIAGRTFTEVAELLNHNRDRVNPSILLGLRRGEDVYLNPRRDRRNAKADDPYRFAESDALIVIAYGPPDLSAFGWDAPAQSGTGES